MSEDFSKMRSVYRPWFQELNLFVKCMKDCEGIVNENSDDPKAQVNKVATVLTVSEKALWIFSAITDIMNEVTKDLGLNGTGPVHHQSYMLFFVLFLIYFF
jgi:hypothetical protein